MRRALATAIVATARVAAADPLDDNGTSAAGTGMAGARTALAVGAEAAHANPAGVARVAGPEVLAGWQYTDVRLAIDGHGAGITAAHGGTFGIAVPLELGDVRVAAGAAVYLPDQYLARLQLFPTGEPQYVRFGANAQRIVIDAVAAVQWHDFALGIGASLLADARSRDLTFDVGVKAREKVGAAHLDIDLPTHAAPVVGFAWRPHPRVELGATFRGQVSLDLAFDIVANVDVPNVVTGNAKIRLRAVTDFTPMRTAVGGAVHVTDDIVVAGDLVWERWSALPSAVADLGVTVALDLAPPLVQSATPPAHFRDIVTPHLGMEWAPSASASHAWRFRAGLAYLPSPVPPQTGVTSLADGARVQSTLGVGLRLPPNALLAQPIDLDLGVSWQHLEHALVTKDPRIQPAGAFTSGGDLVQAGASATVRF